MKKKKKSNERMCLVGLLQHEDAPDDRPQPANEEHRQDELSDADQDLGHVAVVEDGGDDGANAGQENVDHQHDQSYKAQGKRRESNDKDKKKKKRIRIRIERNINKNIININKKKDMKQFETIWNISKIPKLFVFILFYFILFFVIYNKKN
jgi:hypothetical protein